MSPSMSPEVRLTRNSCLTHVVYKVTEHVHHYFTLTAHAAQTAGTAITHVLQLTQLMGDKIQDLFSAISYFWTF